MESSGSQPAIGVVIATRDRLAGLRGTLARLLDLAERPPVVVVDNGSSDGTASALRGSGLPVAVIELRENIGGAARTVGARALETPYVALSDDDSWWEPGALARAVDVFERHPRLALLAARILVGEDGRPDPTCEEMARSPLGPAPHAPGRRVLGFVACGAVVRRSAFLDVGGFDRRFNTGGEEEPLALALAADGWELSYCEEVVARHHPARGTRPGRERLELRNALWSAWLRRPLPGALRATGRLLARARSAAPRGLADAARGLPWIVRERRVVPPHVERDLCVLERAGRT